jgi:hypothetical protein
LKTKARPTLVISKDTALSRGDVLVISVFENVARLTG